MSSLRAILVIAGKDLAQRSRDRSAFIMGLVGPLALALIMSGTLGGANDPGAFELALAIEDAGPTGAEFRNLVATLEAEGVVTLTKARDRPELDRLVHDGRVDAGFHVGRGFSAAIHSASPATITIVGDPGAPVATDVAEAIAGTFAAEVDYVALATSTVLATTGDTDLGGDSQASAATAAALAQPSLIDLAPSETEGRGRDLSSYYAASISVFFLFFSVQFGVLSLIEEREGGTLDRILMAPIANGAVLVGKLMSSFVIGVLSMVVLVAATSFAVGAEWGEPVAVAVLIVFGVLVAMAVAALVAALAKTAEQALSFASAAALVLGLLGGTFFPISQAGGLLAAVSFLSPHRWLLDGFRDVSFGAGLAELGPTLAVLGGFVVVIGGIGLTATGKTWVRV